MRREQGSATVITLTVVLLALFMLVGVVGIGRVAAARASASTAADLAALAGATGGCEVAATTAAANGAQLQDCRTAGADVVVTAVRRVAVAGRTLTIRARARAGPDATDLP